MPSKLELFLLRDEEGPILYAPLRKISVRLNEAAVGSVARRLQGQSALPEDEEVLEALEGHHLFDPAPVPESPIEKPVHVTLFPTDGCNLRCRYCYAGAEKARHVMPVSVGRAAVDLVLHNALEQGKDRFEVSFHGNGEPFTAFHVVREVAEYAKERAEQTGIECDITATSNGVMEEDILDWVIAWVDDITISFDGLPHLQNLQRPMADGGESFPAADRTLRRLNESGKSFSIRTTLTQDSVEQLVPLALSVAERYPFCRMLHIEPAWESGRSLTNSLHSPDPDRFASLFLEADELLSGRLQLVYSADREGYLDNAFCQAPKDGFTVTAQGYVTACYELCEPSIPGSERYLYGRWDPGEGAEGFVLNPEKMAKLHTLTVDNMPYCQDCFCKYSCCGDCPAKLIGSGDPAGHHGSQRCKITRAITLARISRALKEVPTP